MTFFSILRPAAIVALAVGLTACGGKASFPINGTVTGLVYDGLTISTNGMDLAIPSTAKTFSFPNSLSYGETFNVVIKTQPAHQSCNTTDPLTGRETSTDTAGRTTAIAIALSCGINSYNIGGAVSGLSTDGLVLTNGSAGGTVAIVSGSTSYTFSAPVAYNVSYGVTVLTQPANAFCTVSNPTGIMGDATVTNINVSCVPV
jgi:hypothetical protein